MRVAIVGSGLSGLTALWFLKQHSEHEVNIYEAEARPGGLLKGVEFKEGKESLVADLGLVSFNAAGSPTLLAFVKSLGLDLRRIPMTLATVRDGVEATVPFVSKLLNPSAWRLGYDILRWHCCAESTDNVPLYQYLKREEYSVIFFTDYLFPHICMLCQVTDDVAAMMMPAGAVIEAVAAATGGEPWFAIDGRGQAVVDKITSIVLPENLHLNTEIVSISSKEYGVQLVERGGAHHIYDHVILAVPSERALKMLRDGGWASEPETEALEAPNWLGHDVNFDHDPAAASVTVQAVTPPPPYQPGQRVASDVHIEYDLERLQGVHGTRVGVYRGDQLRTSFKMAGAVGLTGAVQNVRSISYVGGWTGRASGSGEAAVLSALELVRDHPFNATPNVPLPSTMRRRGMVATLARIIFSCTEQGRRFLAPFWAVLAWPVALAFAVVEIAARPLPTPIHREVRTLRAAWESVGA